MAKRHERAATEVVAFPPAYSHNAFYAWAAGISPLSGHAFRASASGVALAPRVLPALTQPGSPERAQAVTLQGEAGMPSVRFLAILVMVAGVWFVPFVHAGSSNSL